MKKLIYPLLLLLGLCVHTLPASAEMSQPSTVSLNLTETLSAKEWTLSVALENPTDSNLTAFQMDISLPAGLSLTAGTPTASLRLTAHLIMLSTINAHTLRIVAFSPSATAIPLTTGEIFSLTLTSATAVTAGNYSLSAKHITLSSRDGTAKTIADASGTLTATEPAVATYTLTYLVDDTTYVTQTYETGATITPPANPEREGHTFNGWTNLPETMPAADTQVSASFTANSYTVTYYLDGEVYTTQDYDYGATITPPEVTVDEGYEFAGWQLLPETMPAANLTIYGYTRTTGIAPATATPDTEAQIYDLSGRLVTSSPTTRLPHGVYIRGKRVIMGGNKVIKQPSKQVGRLDV